MIERRPITQLLMTAIVIAAWLFAPSSLAQPQQIAVLISKETDHGNQFIEHLINAGITVSQIKVGNGASLLPLELQLANVKSVIIIGKQAFEYYLANQVNIPALVLFVKHSTFHHLTRAAYHQNLVESSLLKLDNISVIYSDPSPKEQMALIKRHYPYPSVSVMLSPLNYYLEDSLNQSAKELGMNLSVLKVDVDVDINRALNTLPTKHALLAIPDHFIYNSMTLKNIIISTYRSGRPLFGFSRAMVKAGAVASVYSDSKDLSEQTLVVLDAMKAGQSVRQYSDFSAIDVNDAVARSLNLISITQEKDKNL